MRTKAQKQHISANLQMSKNEKWPRQWICLHQPHSTALEATCCSSHSLWMKELRQILCMLLAPTESPLGKSHFLQSTAETLILMMPQSKVCLSLMQNCLAFKYMRTKAQKHHVSATSKCQRTRSGQDNGYVCISPLQLLQQPHATLHRYLWMKVLRLLRQIWCMLLAPTESPLRKSHFFEDNWRNLDALQQGDCSECVLSAFLSSQIAWHPGALDHVSATSKCQRTRSGQDNGYVCISPL